MMPHVFWVGALTGALLLAGLQHIVPGRDKVKSTWVLAVLGLWVIGILLASLGVGLSPCLWQDRALWEHLARRL